MKFYYRSPVLSSFPGIALLSLVVFGDLANNLEISRKCIAATKPLLKTSYGDLKSELNNFQQDTQEMKKQWAGLGDLSGRMVILSAQAQEFQFAEIKEGLEEFFSWFTDTLQNLQVDFESAFGGDFDYVAASSQADNKFNQWLGNV